jgi:hypothetical protein
MAMDEPRRELHRRLDEVLGTDEARTLMDELGRTRRGVEDLRTELRLLEERVGSRFDLLEERMDRKLSDLRADLLGQVNEQTKTLFRTFLVTNSAMVLAVATLAFGTARLT